MSSSMRDELLICVGRLKGMLSMMIFDDDEESSGIQDKLMDVAQDMELVLRGVDERPAFLKGGGDDDV